MARGIHVAKRVQDVSEEYEATPATDADVAQILRQAKPLTTGKLEKDVDAVLRSKGLPLNESLPTRPVKGPRTKNGLRR